jgi:hypothetical protein
MIATPVAAPGLRLVIVLRRQPAENHAYERRSASAGPRRSASASAGDCAAVAGSAERARHDRHRQFDEHDPPGSAIGEPGEAGEHGDPTAAASAARRVGRKRP